jgi:hypothetical protein
MNSIELKELNAKELSLTTGGRLLRIGYEIYDAWFRDGKTYIRHISSIA